MFEKSFFVIILNNLKFFIRIDVTAIMVQKIIFCFQRLSFEGFDNFFYLKYKFKQNK